MNDNLTGLGWEVNNNFSVLRWETNTELLVSSFQMNNQTYEYLRSVDNQLTALDGRLDIKLINSDDTVTPRDINSRCFPNIVW
jgi:hypothetical protein